MSVPRQNILQSVVVDVCVCTGSIHNQFTIHSLVIHIYVSSAPSDITSADGSTRQRVKPSRDKLTNMFSQAWQAGKLAEQMGDAKKEESVDGIGVPGTPSETFFEEKSGMFTLRRNKEKGQDPTHSKFKNGNGTRLMTHEVESLPVPIFTPTNWSGLG